jgi:DNA invertase Pin-like site-specific DNA recombinase
MAAYARRGGRSAEAMTEQEPALRRWADAGQPLPVRWYRDGGADEDGSWPSRARLLAAVNGRTVHTVCVWRIDRLGPTTRELAEVFAKLAAGDTRLVALEEGVHWSPEDLAGLARGLASMSKGERETRIDRLAAGQARARAQGLHVGRPHAITDAQAAEVKRLVDEGVTRSRIATALKVSRGSIRQALLRVEAGAAAAGHT